MIRSALSLMMALVVLVCAPMSVYAAGIATAADLVAIDRDKDGTRVTFEGEAVGEDLRADADHRWVNLLSGGTALGVYMADSDAAVIDNWGEYSTTGDTVRVTGIIHIACDEHAGEFDVHAETVSVRAPGGAIERPLRPWKGALGLLTASAGIYFWWYFGRIRERRLI